MIHINVIFGNMTNGQVTFVYKNLEDAASCIAFLEIAIDDPLQAVKIPSLGGYVCVRAGIISMYSVLDTMDPVLLDTSDAAMIQSRLESNRVNKLVDQAVEKDNEKAGF